MSGTPRFLKLSEAPQYRDSTWALIAEHFPKGEPTIDHNEVTEEFALLLHSQNESRVWICVVDDKVVSTSSWRPFLVNIPGRPQPIPCAGVGLVVTDPAHRKKGFAASLQKELEQAAIHEGMHLSLLWSDLHDFYMKQGFLPAGTEYMWSLAQKDMPTFKKHPSVVIERLKKLSEISDLYDAAKHGPQRDWDLYEPLLKLSNTFGLVARDTQTKKPLAYLLMGKARDLRNTVHEIVGDASMVAPLIESARTCLEHKTDELRLQIPADSPLKTTLSDLYGPPELSALSYMKILSTEHVCEWINKNQILSSNILLEPKKDGSGFILKNDNQIVWDSPDEGHLLQLFFGPWKPAALAIPKSLKTQLNGTQSIGIYFWGFDSV